MTTRYLTFAFAVLAASGCVGSSSAQSEPPSDTPDGIAAELARDEAFLKSEFVAAGLPSIDALAAAGRQVRRVWLRGPYPSALPVMQLERLADGRVEFSLWREGRAIRQADVPTDVWPAVEDEVFAVAGPVPHAARTPPATACHGDVAYFEAAERGAARVAAGMACEGALWPLAAARGEALDRFARLALDTLDCEGGSDQSAGWALTRCLTATDIGG